MPLLYNPGAFFKQCRNGKVMEDRKQGKSGKEENFKIKVLNLVLLTDWYWFCLRSCLRFLVYGQWSKKPYYRSDFFESFKSFEDKASVCTENHDFVQALERGLFLQKLSGLCLVCTIHQENPVFSSVRKE